MAELSNKGGYRPDTLPSRLPTLTGMRMVAALLVFLFHAGLQGFFASQGFAAQYSSVVYQGSWAAISFFFVLSGFVLTWAARPKDTTRSYYRRRVLKVYPNHLITAGVAALLMFLVVGMNLGTGGPTPGPGTVLANLLLIQSWSPDWMVRTALNGPAWSLSCEVLFYLLFPLFFLLIKRIRPERLWAWFSGVAALTVIAVPVVGSTLVPHANPVPGMGLSLEQFWFLVHFPPTRALEFVLGMILARIVISGRRLPLSLGGATAWTVAAYALTPLFPEAFATNAVMLVPIALLIAQMAVADTQKRRSWLSGRVMVKLGEISFAFYLVHQLVLQFGDYWLGNRTYSTSVGIAVVLLMFSVALGLSYLLFTYVEDPIMRKWSRPRKRTPEPVPVVSIPLTVTGGKTEQVA
jgi:peptidoglycan/LPS O-acetylase OafA/YrhL